MVFRKFVVAFVVVSALGASIQYSNAFVPPPPPIVGGTTVGAGIYAAGGIIAIAGILVGYDLYLKLNGLKNWDGTAKKAKP